MLRGSSANSTEPTDQSHHSAWPFLIGCCLLLAAMEVLIFLYTRNPHHWSDFRSYYVAEFMMRTQPSNLYNIVEEARLQNLLVAPGFLIPFLHLPYEALVFSPLSLLPFHAAYFTSIALNTIFIVATFFAARPLFSQKISYLQPWPGLLLLIYPGIAVSICWGQDSVLVLLLCCLAWQQMRRGKDLSAGCLMALALCKFQLALPIAIVMAARKGWRFSTGFLVTGLALIALCFGIVGKAGMARLFHLLSRASLVNDNSPQSQRATSIHPTMMPNLEGLLHAAGTRFMPAHASFMIVAVASLCVLLWSMYGARRAKHDDIAFAMAVLCSILVSYHFYPYDLVLIVLPIALLARHVHYAIPLTLFWFPEVSVAIFGIRWGFLSAIPLLLLLAYLGTGSRNANAEPLHTTLATPLHT